MFVDRGRSGGQAARSAGSEGRPRALGARASRLEAGEAVDPGEAVDLRGPVAGAQIDPLADDVAPQLLPLFEHVLHLRGVERPLAVGRQPEPVALRRRAAVEEQPVRRLSGVGPDLERPEDLTALDGLPRGGRALEEEEAGTVVTPAEQLAFGEPAAARDPFGELVAGGLRQRIVGQSGGEATHPRLRSERFDLATLGVGQQEKQRLGVCIRGCREAHRCHAGTGGGESGREQRHGHERETGSGSGEAAALTHAGNGSKPGASGSRIE